ncbi:hypothetical protein HOLleu_32772 [Holothuria leucospilota]|uniref:Ig-like domain-containing protein n=1 Tax=Holothuria leucospilota TaxID=206669 RepID=A0A9Q1BJD6_HOLLE|nr:hypothetical protein HOLleu_32772 [Holothuria leucospilota]
MSPTSIILGCKVFLISCILQVCSCNSETDQKIIFSLQSTPVILGCQHESTKGNMWTHNGKIVFAGNNVIATHLKGTLLLLQNYSLFITSSSIFHDGLYKCIRNASNVEIYSLSVEVEPELFLSVNGRNVTNDTVIYADKIMAQCYATRSKPAVSITWIMNNNVMEPSNDECVPSERDNRLTYNCMSTLETQIKAKNGTLMCLTSNHSTFEAQLISVQFITTNIPQSNQIYLSCNQKLPIRDMQNISFGEKLCGDGYFNCWKATVACDNTIVVAKTLPGE